MERHTSRANVVMTVFGALTGAVSHASMAQLAFGSGHFGGATVLSL